jgi:hypothetical protein
VEDVWNDAREDDDTEVEDEDEAVQLSREGMTAISLQRNREMQRVNWTIFDEVFLAFSRGRSPVRKDSLLVDPIRVEWDMVAVIWRCIR